MKASQSSRLHLKVCGMKQANNLRDLLDQAPDYVGFIFYPKSPRYMAAGLDPDWVKGLSGFRKVGVFVDAPLEAMADLYEQYGLDYLQLHGQESPALCQQLKARGIGLIKVFSIGTDFNFDLLRPYEPWVDFFLFDTKGKQPGGNGVLFNWDLLQAYPSELPFFLSGGISLGNIERLAELSWPHLHAIDVNSRFERKDGLKDITRIRALQATLKSPLFTS